MMIALVGCGAAKLSRPAPARELYTGAPFRAAVAYAEALGARVFVASGLHGLVELDAELEPYDHRLVRREARVWGERVVAALLARVGPTPRPSVLVMGDVYAAPLRRAWPALWPAPAEPLRGIQWPGRRAAWLRAHTPERR